jgi:hypothetical protein
MQFLFIGFACAATLPGEGRNAPRSRKILHANERQPIAAEVSPPPA